MRFLRSFTLVLAPLLVWESALPGARAESPSADAPPTVVATVSPQTPATLFDPARHMRVSEVKPGMTGYGLSVFHGTKIERFEVEVISVLVNFNPKNDVVLIRCKGDYLEHTGSIAGMSGSPIYLKDDAGHDRMIGAFAYGWPLTKDPIAGVQPIEYMLALPPAEKPQADTDASSPTAGGGSHSEKPGAVPHAAWSLLDAGLLPVGWANEKPSAMTEVAGSGSHARQLLGDGSVPRLQPLATPLMTSGLSPKVFAKMASQFQAAGLVPLQAGVGGSAAPGSVDTRLVPGSALAVPLLTGDMEMSAIGSVTEVVGNRVFGFGHPFNNEGQIDLPMGAGVVNGVVANLNTSFKLGALTELRGTLTTDASVGVAGNLGATPRMIPMDIQVQSADGAAPRTYHFNVAHHAKLTPMLAAAAFNGAVSGSSEPPANNTTDYDLQMSFSNGQTVSLTNRAVNTPGGDLFGDAAIVIDAASNNPFQRASVTKITGTVKVSRKVQAAQIIDIDLPKNKYHPGDKVKAYVSYQPFRGAPAVLPVELDLPRDLPTGEYQLVVSDAKRYFQDQQRAEPFRFTAENITDVFSVLKDVGSIRENAIYVRLVRHPDGVAVGHTALAHLPSSRREILLNSGRSNTTPFIDSKVRIVPTELVMSGASDFVIVVETTSKSVVGTPHGGKVEPIPAPVLKPDESKKTPSEVPGKIETPQG